MYEPLGVYRQENLPNVNNSLLELLQQGVTELHIAAWKNSGHRVEVFYIGEGGVVPFGGSMGMERAEMLALALRQSGIRVVPVSGENLETARRLVAGRFVSEEFRQLQSSQVLPLTLEQIAAIGTG